MLADFYSAQVQCSQDEASAAQLAEAKNAASACLMTLLRADPIRSQYWLHRLHSLCSAKLQ